MTIQASTTTPRKIKLYITRHGQTHHNKLKILQGHSNSQLTELGQTQAQMLGKHLAKSNISFDYVYTSDLDRCVVTTAGILAPDTFPTVNDLPSNVVRTAELRERAMAELENMPIADAHELARQNGKTISDYGELHSQVTERVEKFMEITVTDLLTRANDSSVSGDDNKDINVLLVTHGGYIKIMRLWMLHHNEALYRDGVATKQQVDMWSKAISRISVHPGNTAMTTIDLRDLGNGRFAFDVKKFGCMAHLEKNFESNFRDGQ